MSKLSDICDRYRVQPGSRARLKHWDPDDDSVTDGDKARGVHRREQLSSRLDELQDLLYAQKKHRVLLILQGMDTSGKDSTIRRVFHTVDPLGVRVANFRAPSSDEQARDYLWRVHRMGRSRSSTAAITRTSSCPAPAASRADVNSSAAWAISPTSSAC